MTVRWITAGVLAAALSSGALSSVLAQESSVTIDGEATITVIDPIAMTKISDLEFGMIVAPSSGVATVSLQAIEGQQTPQYSDGASPGVVNLGDTRVSAAIFDVTGEATFSYTLALDLGAVATANGVLAFAMETDGGTTVSAGNVGIEERVLSASGEDRVIMGGELTIDGSAPRELSLPFSVTAAYN